MALLQSPIQPNQNTDDFHDLVSLEPPLRDYVHLPPPTAPSSSANVTSTQQNNHSRQPSAPLFSSFSSSSITANQEAESRLTHSRPASMSQRRSTRWPFLSLSSRGSGSTSRASGTMEPLLRPSTTENLYHDANGQSSAGSSTAPPTIVLNAQKDSDDVDDTHEVGRRRGAPRRDTSTSTRVNRLFTMQSPSPATSREPSFQKTTHQFDYKRCKASLGMRMKYRLLILV